MASTVERLSIQIDSLDMITGEQTMAITTLADVKSYLGIGDTTYDANITRLIPLVEADYLRIRNIPWDVDGNGDTVYPDGSDVTAAEMIGWKLSRTGSGSFNTDYGQTVASESLDAHSISYATGTGSGGNIQFGYPKDVISSIAKFINGA